MEYKIIKTFTFLDESGVLSAPKSATRKYFGLGIFKHTNPNGLIQDLHREHEGLCAELKKDETKVEFSFKATTRKSIKYDLAFLDILKRDYDWEFNCLYFDTSHPDFESPRDSTEYWEKYITFSKLLLRKNLWSMEETVLLSDYQRKPKTSRKKFEYLALDIPQVHSALQVESHGVLLVQAADMLLGGYLYSLDPNAGDKEGNKTRVSNKVMEIKEKVGKKKFNCWEIHWDS